MQSTRAAGRQPTSASGDAGTGDDPARMLKRWLCDPASPAPTLQEIEEAFDVRFGVRESKEADDLASRLELTVATLRDLFPTDAAVRRWLRAPHFDLGGERPMDLLLGLRLARLEQCALQAWSSASQSVTSFGDDSCP